MSYFNIIVGIIVVVATLILVKKLRKPKRKPITYSLISSGEDNNKYDNIYLITGGNGFLGTQIVRTLQDRKKNKKFKIFIFDVVAPRTKLEDVSYIVGDLTNEQHVKRALIDSQADTVFHVASLKPGAGIGDDVLTKINVGGTQNILNQIKENKEVRVNRIIYTSSATVVIGENTGNLLNITEDQPYPEKPLDGYTKTKGEAERLIINASEKLVNGQGEKVICLSLRPTGIFGRNDDYLAGPLLQATNNKYVGSGTALIDWIDSDNVALAHVLAEENFHPGSRLVSQIYTIAHTDKMEYRQFNGHQSTGPNGEPHLSHWGTAHPQSIPLGLCKVLALINELCAKYLGTAPFGMALTVATIKFTQTSYTFSTEKAREHFGFYPAQSLSDTIKGFAKGPNTFYSKNLK